MTCSPSDEVGLNEIYTGNGQLKHILVEIDSLKTKEGLLVTNSSSSNYVFDIASKASPGTGINEACVHISWTPHTIFINFTVELSVKTKGVVWDAAENPGLCLDIADS